MGAGYNIPISVSYSRTDTTNPVFGAATNFFFSSPWASAGTNDQSARNTDTSTATSAAAQGNLAQQASAQTSGANAPGATGSAGADGTQQSLSIPPIALWTLGGAFAVLVGVIWFTRK